MFGANPVFTIMILSFYLLGFLCAAAAILRSRTPQGATAWIVGLITLPFFTVPLYIIFGRSKFYGYTTRRKSFDDEVNARFSDLGNLLTENHSIPHDLTQLMNSMNPLCRPGFTGGNRIKLLVNAKETYLAMLKDLEEAKEHIIFQFYVFRSDSIGWKFTEVLMRKARQGLNVNFLYDEIGTEIPQELIDEMQASGIQVCHFNSLKGKGRFQINFRNHRKILIVDGKVAYAGGLNIGDDYLGLWPELGPWRDTHVRLEGPSVIAAQIAHAKDWYWCQKKDLKVDWKIRPTEGKASVLVLPTGPADDKQTCLLAHIAMVNAAQKRLWIANPYLVPPESLLDAILLAALRGVDVRIIIPSYSDAWIVMIACRVYVARLLKHGVKVYRYTGGFLHQKVMLVDDLVGAVGSANLDFRSMFINFEISVMAYEDQFVKELEEMLENDFKHCSAVTVEEFQSLSLWKKITSRAANLLAPVL